MISIIIVHYGKKELLFSCIKSIKASHFSISTEIIVVDNDEKKRIGGDLHKKFPKVSYVKSKNIGYGASCNLGARSAKGDYLFFLNPDTRLYRDTLAQLLKFIKTRSDVGAVSPLLIQENRKPQAVVGSQFPTPIRVIFSLSLIHRLFPDNFISRKFFLQDWNKNDSRRVDVFPGTAFMMKKIIFEKIGGFDKNYFLFYEEADLAKKITSIGLKNYIIPSSKLIHIGGQSTGTRGDMKKIFRKSQFYYFRKHFGIIPAIFVKVITSINKYHLILLVLFAAALFLRIYKLSDYMSFIGDQGWFYLSARDMLLTGNIPLVGITSSHTWLHQGPYWTYILGFIFSISKFNPLAPAYFTGFIGSITVLLIYKFFKEMFSRRVGIISAFLYATSPLAVINDRFPYHSTLIPVFTLFYIYSLYKWIKGEKKYFVWSVTLLGILYNFELATFSLGGVLIALLLFGIFKRKKWAVSLSDKKIILFSFIGLSAVMLPVIIYDIKNGFLQTFGFLLWILYKIARTFLSSSATVLGNNTDILHFLLDRYKLFTFASNFSISILFLCSSFVFFSYLLKKEKSVSLFVIAISTVIILFGFMANKTASDAYLSVFFPIIIVISAIFWSYVIKKIKLAGFIFLVIFGFMNVHYFLNYDLSSRNAGFVKRKEAVNKIIELTSGKQYNLIGKGEGSQFESFTMNYEYLLWQKGHPPSKTNVKNKIIVSESPKGVIIEKK